MQTWTSLPSFSRRLRARSRDERGQSLVEFAMVLPVLILIILGILYFGRYEDYSNQMTQLAESGARLASVDYNSTGTLQAYIQSQAQGELANGSSDVSAPIAVYIYYPSTAPSGNVVGNALRVCVVATVKYPFLAIGSSTIEENATMRIEVLADSNSFTANIPAASTGCPLT
jgi:Flp pilus assembly protein TadG